MGNKVQKQSSSKNENTFTCMINTKKPQKIISTKNHKEYSNKDDIKFQIDLEAKNKKTLEIIQRSILKAEENKSSPLQPLLSHESSKVPAAHYTPHRPHQHHKYHIMQHQQPIISQSQIYVPPENETQSNLEGTKQFLKQQQSRFSPNTQFTQQDTINLPTYVQEFRDKIEFHETMQKDFEQKRENMQEFQQQQQDNKRNQDAPDPNRLIEEQLQNKHQNTENNTNQNTTQNNQNLNNLTNSMDDSTEQNQHQEIEIAPLRKKNYFASDNKELIVNPNSKQKESQLSESETLVKLLEHGNPVVNYITGNQQNIIRSLQIGEEDDLKEQLLLQKEEQSQKKNIKIKVFPGFEKIFAYQPSNYARAKQSISPVHSVNNYHNKQKNKNKNNNNKKGFSKTATNNNNNKFLHNNINNQNNFYGSYA